jgi:hypothetical protein
VHCLMEFYPGSKPDVSIARELSFQYWREHRKRSTLPHEYGHVHWHTLLQSPGTPSGLVSGDTSTSATAEPSTCSADLRVR